MGYEPIEPQSDEDFEKIQKNIKKKQIFDKIESNYKSLDQLKIIAGLLETGIDFLITENISEYDKHLIKDFRRNYNRILNLIKNWKE